ncbi:2-amino-4-hydroxy-6-hydroxymethyldihydropteridine diphosphokinase [Epibacterium sp. Ofav1-8]|uniref:2-amino-4-hydroxy-6- hydroxymethyldihydropteridine diphosphokinase n=1 Tax=Epibacterium sp. Ofav1-8 TaxID=2917735 RepID=UPI001EF60BCF|nr:2-amino-4-hydroxy-6-hydroxymethyldihydropteridine diphosphokinase [Epibacterium sp. Ofav1-8]MCG7624110.1 2-amino-4-hydroxy-6-hydroxymethyldihydropteridine diphosphokinase [Epibacterium sp. Ofav1-8]
MAEIRSSFLVALGSNLQNAGTTPLETVQACLAEFAPAGLQVIAISNFYRTPCFPAGAGPDYVNAAVELRASLSPAEVLSRLHKIEAQFQRTRTQRWGMRTLDLDLLAAEQRILPDVQTYETWRTLPAERQRQEAPDQLVLPHPRIQDRAFVLVPLADVARDWVHPILNRSVGQMLADCDAADLAEVQAL